MNATSAIEETNNIVNLIKQSSSDLKDSINNCNESFKLLEKEVRA